MSESLNLSKYKGGQLQLVTHPADGVPETIAVVVDSATKESNKILIQGTAYRRKHGVWMCSPRKGFWMMTPYQSIDVLEGVVVWKGTETHAKLLPKGSPLVIAIEPPTMAADGVLQHRLGQTYTLLFESVRETTWITALMAWGDVRPTPVIPLEVRAPNRWTLFTMEATRKSSGHVTVKGIVLVRQRREGNVQRTPVQGVGQDLAEALGSALRAKKS